MKTNTLKTLQLLPAVMMSLATMNSPMASAAVAAPGTPGGGTPARGGAVPAVLRFQPESSLVEPEPLRQYVRILMRDTGISTLEDGRASVLPRCGTISGSDNGWDDSGQDC